MKQLFLCFCLIWISWPGLLAQEHDHYFVFLHTNPSREELPQEEADSLQTAHINNIGQLAREGKLSVAGPFEGGGGIFILNSSSLEEAKSWLLTDPAIRAGRFKLEILPWKSRRNEPCLADENAEMKEYTFIRYEPHITKFNVRQSPQLFKQHDDYLKKVIKAHHVITEGLFMPNDGGVLILEGVVDKDMIQQDPVIQEGMLIPEYKTIWMAEGSFCQASEG